MPNPTKKGEMLLGVKNDTLARPIRTCFGCGVKKNKKDFWRLSLNKDIGVISWDSKYLLGGRGVYCCMDKLCVQRLLKNKKRLARAFRVEVVEWSEVSALLSLD